MMHSLTRTFAVVTTLTSALAFNAPAFAGTLQLRDAADLLDPAQESALRSAAARYAFDVRVLTDTRATSRSLFDRQVAAQLAGPGMVVVGIDPVHHWTSVHFGTATRIATARFAAIENAGDPYFRTARWSDGLDAILVSAQSSVGTAPAASTRAGSESPGFPWGLVIFGLVAVGGIALVSRALRNRDSSRNPMAGGDAWQQQQGYRAHPGYGPQPGYGPPPGYGPAPGSSIGTGLAGAALGGLAGYALGNAMSHGDQRPDSQAGVTGNEPNESWDAGGSASGWDDGGGDVGGGDAGGGDW